MQKHEIKSGFPKRRAAFCLFFLILITACAAQYPLNRGVENPDLIKHVPEPAGQDQSDLILILAFSGGGTRAASLAYGTLEALKRVELPGTDSSGRAVSPDGFRHRNMLDKISVITAVSGGSFTAAYYGLHGEGIFKDFREHFLLRDIQGDLFLKFINPFNWPRLSSPRFGRSDLAQEYYDRILFKGATLGDMGGKNRPLIAILATDAVEGAAFPFTRDTFQWICSDFDKFPVSRAVAASSAVPGSLSPVILKNYSSNCRAEKPAWIQAALDAPDPYSRTYNMALRANAYLDPKKKPFMHLVDGGISDNLGLRAIIDRVMIRGGLRDALEMSRLEKTRRVAFIVVDAETEVTPSWGILGEIPGIGAILGASSTILINKYNFETLDLLRRNIESWKRESEAARNPIDFYLVHLTFNSLPEAVEQNYYHGIPTSLSLPVEQVDRIRAVAAKLLYSSAEFQRLVRDMEGRIVKYAVGNGERRNE